ncbi:MAG: LacI family DNA-binding transcriptional regulator [Bacteroidota bacterium]
MKSGKKEQVTIHDIAKQLEVTASTVSRALNDHPRISKATKQLVKETARKLNYQHNHLAAALRSGKSSVIGVMVPTADRYFFSSIVRGIEDVASQRGYSVMICQNYDTEEKEKKNLEVLLRSQVDGIMASIGKTTADFSHFKQVLEKSIPLVLFDRTTPKLDVHTVTINDYQGAYSATEHLIQQGCRKIVHFAGPQNLNIYQERKRGYIQALQDAGIPVKESLIIYNLLQFEDGVRDAKYMLQLPEKIDGLFSASDYAAMGAMQVLKYEGVRIPTDIAVVGFMNEPYTSFVTPSLSTVDQRTQEMGKRTAEIFFTQVEKDSGNQDLSNVVLEPTLIIRESSRRA